MNKTGYENQQDEELLLSLFRKMDERYQGMLIGEASAFVFASEKDAHSRLHTSCKVITLPMRA